MTLAHAFEDAGMPRDKAEAVAGTIIDAIHDNVATKADLQTTAAGLRTDLAQLRHELTMRGIAGLLAAGSILFAALHLWPPGHGGP